MNAQVIGHAESQRLPFARQALGWARRRLFLDHASDRLRDLRILERLAVGPKQYVIVVECAGERFLVGTSTQGVQTMVRLEAGGSASSHPARRVGDL